MKMRSIKIFSVCLLLISFTSDFLRAEDKQLSSFSPLPETITWKSSPPLLTARAVDGLPWHSVKDPSVVYDGKLYHLFVTVRGTEKSHSTVYLNFADWKDAENAEQHTLPMHPGYFCAPQVFWYEPHQLWYLICQASSDDWDEPKYRVTYSTNKDIKNYKAWTPLKPMFPGQAAPKTNGIDFWVICDDTHAYLFFTSNNGLMWRSRTTLDKFPLGWNESVICLKDKIFEASHTYKLKGFDKYLTIIEEQNGYGFRYYKSYMADSLMGEWKPWHATKENSFASMKNVTQPAPKWTDAISHGELIRSGINQKLEIDPKNLQFLYQGCTSELQKGKKYGDIPWQLGILYQE